MTELLVVLVRVPVMGDRLQVTPLPDVSPVTAAVTATEPPACSTPMLLATETDTVMRGGGGGGGGGVELPLLQPVTTMSKTRTGRKWAGTNLRFTGSPIEGWFGTPSIFPISERPSYNELSKGSERSERGQLLPLPGYTGL